MNKTITVTSTVTGTGNMNFLPGQVVRLNGKDYQIINVMDNSSLTVGKLSPLKWLRIKLQDFVFEVKMAYWTWRNK